MKAVIARKNEPEKTLAMAIKFADHLTFISVGGDPLQSCQHPVTDGQCLAAPFIGNQHNLRRSRDGSFPCCGNRITIIGDRDDVNDSYRRQLIRAARRRPSRVLIWPVSASWRNRFRRAARPSALIPKALAISLILGGSGCSPMKAIRLSSSGRSWASS